MRDIRDLVKFVRAHSPYYEALYRDLPQFEINELGSLPFVQHAGYWAAASSEGNKVLTAPQIDGIVIRTGGTTSKPKFTRYSQPELARTGTLLGQGLVAAGLRSGDRVGNLFYAGELYGSFLLHILSVLSVQIPAIQIPIGGLTEPRAVESYIDACDVNVLLSTATTLVKLAKYCLQRKRTFKKIDRIMFSGEPLFADQDGVLQEVFPCATLQSCVYGSIDAGVVGVSAGYDDWRVHRVVCGVEAEIRSSNDSKSIIQENGQSGSLVITNIVRRLMPVIRYPTGDRAEWVDRDAGIFRLLGRDQLAARLGPVSIDIGDLRNIVGESLQGIPVIAFQAIIRRHDAKDLLECRIDANPPDKEAAALAIKERLNSARPMFKQHVDDGYIAEAQVVFLPFSEMLVNQSTGKLQELVDARGTV